MIRFIAISLDPVSMERPDEAVVPCLGPAALISALGQASCPVSRDVD